MNGPPTEDGAYDPLAMGGPVPELSRAFAGLADGDPRPAAELMEIVYEELRALAAKYFQRRSGPHTLQPTALVHEAFLRVAERTGRQVSNRAHFSAVCALAMRGILADHARRKRAEKRGGGRERVTLADLSPGSDLPPLDVLDLDEALEALRERNARQALIVQYRFFSGMTVDEVASVLGVSRSTIENDWRMARAWLMVRLANGRAE